MPLLLSRAPRALALTLPMLVALSCSSSSDDTEIANPSVGAALPEETIELAGPRGNFGPYLDAAQAASQAYSGNTIPAVLNDDNASEILDMVLFGPLSAGDNKLFASGYLASTLMRDSQGDLLGYTDSDEADYRLCANADGTGLLNWGVSREIEGDTSLREVDLTYTNCLVEGKLLNGVVMFASGTEVLNGSLPAHYFRYDNLQVTQTDDTVWTFNGVDAFPLGASCVELGAAQSYLSAQRADTGATWLFDNLVTTLYQDAAGTRCTALFNDTGEPTVYSTQLAHSEYGLVSVTQDTGGEEEPGFSVDIVGDSGSSINFEKSFVSVPVEVEQSDVNVLENRISFGTVTSRFASDDQERSVEQALSAVRLGGLLPMRDSDEDGLTDGYELAYELGDTDATDDVDRDGISALDELSAGSNPTDARDSGWTVDRQITVLRDQLSASSGLENFYVSIDNQSNRLSAGGFEFTVSVSGTATFVSAEATSIPTFDFFGNSTTFAEVACEFTDTALNTLQCSAGSDEACVSYNEGGQRVTECETDLLLQRKFSVNPGATGSFEVNAELSAHPLEQNLSNNVATSGN